MGLEILHYKTVLLKMQLLNTQSEIFLFLVLKKIIILYLRPAFLLEGYIIIVTPLHFRANDN